MLEHEINAPELLEVARSGLTGRAGRPTRIAVMGAGIAGLCAGALGAKEVVLTDEKPFMADLYNIQRNFASRPEVEKKFSAKELKWGEVG